MSVTLQWEHKVRSIILPLRCLMPVPPRCDNICLLPPAAGDQGLSVPPWREHNPSSATLLAPVTHHSRSLRLRFFRWCVLPSPNPAGRAPFSTRTANPRITGTASLCSSGILAQHANTPHKFWRRPAEDSMRSSCKKPVIMPHKSRTSSLCRRAARTLPSCSTRTRSSPTLLSSPSPRPLPARTRAKWRHWWFVDCCVALSGSLTVTFCSVHVHNVGRLHAHMVQHNVDFIGGDFNMSAFSTAGDVFENREFAALGNSLLWGLCDLDDSCRECTGFIIMPWRPYEWRVDADGCYKFDNAELGFGHRDQTAHFPVYLHLRTTNLPGPDSITRSAQAQQRRMDRAAGKYERKRLRKQLALQSTSHPLSSQYCRHEKTSCAHFPRQPPCHMLERPTCLIVLVRPNAPCECE